MAAYCFASKKRARDNESRSVLRMTQQMHKTCICNTQLHFTVGVLREITTTTTTLLPIRSADKPKVKNRCLVCVFFCFCFDRLGVGQNILLCASFAASNITAVAEIEVPLCIEAQASKGLAMSVCVCLCVCLSVSCSSR